MNDLIEDILDRYEELSEQGQEVSAEELCAENPELIDEVRRRINSLKATSWMDDDDDDFKGDSPSDYGLPPKLGRFHLECLVGEGGFGQVWKARDSKLNRMVAIKVPRAIKFTTTTEMERFLEEAKLVAKLKHPSIISIYDVGTEKGLIFLVSEFIDGKNLAERLQEKKYSPEEAAKLVATVAEALQDAHDQGFVHRDIKPANILIDTNGQPFVTDFGISASTEKLVEGQIPSIGTRSYMSPEQLVGKSCDTRADIYSLGVVLFELLTGNLPYTEPDEVKFKINVASGRNRAALDESIPIQLRRICERCLEPDRDDRFQTAEELANELKQFFVSKSRLPIAVAGVLILTILSVAAFPYLRPDDSSSPSVSQKTANTDSEPANNSETAPVKTTASNLKSPTSVVGDQTTDIRTALTLGNQHLVADRWQEALSEFNRVIELDAENPEALWQRGVCYFNLARIPEAITDLTFASELKPDDAEIRGYLSLALFRANRVADGIMQAEKSFELDRPVGAEYLSACLCERALRAEESGDKESAMADLNRAVEAAPNRAMNFDRRGVLNYNLNRRDAALIDFNEAIRLDSKTREFYLHRGLCLRALGREEDAEKDYEMAGKL